MTEEAKFSPNRSIKHSDVLIIVPAYNEARAITKTIEDLRGNLRFADIIVIDDSSTDETREVLRTLNVCCLPLPVNLGYSGAVQAGFKYAVKHSYKFVLQFDADGQHIAQEALKLYEEILSTNSDIVIGSRFMKKSDYQHPFLKQLGTLLFQKSIRLLTGSEVSDPTSGLQIINHRVAKVYSQIFNYPDFPDANLLIKMMLRGIAVREVPVKMRQREFGSGMHTGLYRPARYMVFMIYSIALIWLYEFLGKNKKG